MPTAERVRRAAVECRKLTAKQAREVRLSGDGHVPLARRFGVVPSVIRDIRAGVRYGPLRPDEQAAQDRRTAKDDGRLSLADYMLIVGSNKREGMIEPDLMEMTDAARECEHGRLPHDRTPACGCWPGETNHPKEEAHETVSRRPDAGSGMADRLVAIGRERETPVGRDALASGV